MKVAIIGPNIVSQKGDFFGTGIPYFPLVVAYTAAYLRDKEHRINLIDAFGEAPYQVKEEGNKYIQGLLPEQVVGRIGKDDELILISAERVVAHNSIVKLIRMIKSGKLSKVPIAILENTQAVTAYSLQKVKDKFFEEGADFVVAGEPETRVEALINALQEENPRDKQAILAKIDGLGYRKLDGSIEMNERKNFISDPDILPFPAWDLFNLRNYWSLKYAHAPLTSRKYLPLLTSRGCPYPCTFCVVPDTNKQRWRPRSAKNVVDEIEQFTKKYGVTEYHLEDLNPTIRKERMVEISKEILARHLRIKWKLASGTKAETLDEETIRWMAKAGCCYISISPESGSARIMKLIRKPFPYERALELVREMDRNNITTQACFVLGYPTEDKEDIRLTRNYIKELVKAGIDEIALFILTPTPGSVVYADYVKENGLDDISKFTFTPIWRKDYNHYSKIRAALYLDFLKWRLLFRPFEVIMQPVHFLLRKFHTKMEMTPYRVFKVWRICTFRRRTIPA